MDDGFGSETMPIFAIAEELGKLNEENFESRRRALSQSVVNLQNDIWETLLTALVLGAIIAGASVFRISSLEKESAAHQKASELAEERLRHLSQQLVSSQEQERKALSRELHDEIGQLLTALRMELGNLERGRGTARCRGRSTPGSGQETGRKHAADARATSPWDCGRPCWMCWVWGRRWNGRRGNTPGATTRPFGWKWTGICATCRIRTGPISIASCRKASPTARAMPKPRTFM